MWTAIMRHSDPLLRLRSSEFRRSMELGQLELLQLEKYGWQLIREHAEKIVRERLSVTTDHDGATERDALRAHGPGVRYGKTPYRGHPVFVAQHATATCCRKCLFKWHRIPPYRELTDADVRFCTGMILRWISAQEDRTKAAHRPSYLPHVVKEAALPVVSSH